MTTSVSLMTEAEVRACTPANDEAGFGTLTTARGGLPLHALDVHTRIDGLLAEITVGQTFVNPTDEPLEAVYIFPLPDRAAVTRFQMQVGSRVVEGVLKERGQARQEYTQAIEQGQRAAITEEDRPGVFSMRVGNLMPRERATVQLTLVGPLAYSDGEATFRFPLVVAPRYIPGIPLSGPSVGAGTVSDTDAVPDASRITPPVLLPGFPNPVHLSLTVDVYPSDLDCSDFRSALHSGLEVISDSGVRRILLQPGERLNRDFILRFRVGNGSLRTALTLTPDAVGSREGTFALTLLPPVSPSQATRARDVVFVLDRSGSMGGWKMVAARRALARMVDTLTERDRFTVYAFDDSIEKPPTFADLGLQPATDRNRFRAVEFLAKVEARGGTEMAQPLSMAAHLLASGQAQREKVLVLITDGQVGNEDQILQSLARDLKSVRVFALGIDQAVNAAFLRRLADLGGGGCELVESEDRLDEVLDNVHRRIGTPVLTSLRLEAAGLQLVSDTLVPSRLPDLFAGAPLQILGRYRGAEGSIRVSGTETTGGSWWRSVTARPGDSGAVTSVWARSHIRELEDRFVTGQGDLSRLEKRIVETSLKYGVLCRFTAFLAVDREEAPNKGGRRDKVLQPVDTPAGWEMPQAPAAAPATFGFAARSLGAMPAAATPPPPQPVAAAPPGGILHKLDRVRRPRAQITYDVETAGAMQAVQLPFVVGVLADLSGNPQEPLKPLKDRKVLAIDRDNFTLVMEKIAPRLGLEVSYPGGTTPLQVELRFRQLEDFDPGAVAAQLPTVGGDSSALLRDVLHHPDFRRLESAWRGLAYLVHETETSDTLKIRVLNVSKQALLMDVQQAPAFEQSVLFKKFYAEEYETLGGQPYALLVGDYEFGHSAEDIRLLSEIARVAAAAHAPFIAAAAPDLCGVQQFADLATVTAFDKLFEGDGHKDWRAFRALSESRYVGLTLPRVEARPPLPGGEEGRLWMSAAWAFATGFTDAIARDGWPARLRGKSVPNPEVMLPRYCALYLSQIGLMAVTSSANFAAVPSCNQPASGDQAANLLARLDCLLCAAVFVRYLTLLARDKVGAFMNEAEAGAWLGQWINGFVLPNPGQADASVQARRPLQGAEVEIRKLPGDPAHFWRLLVRLQPYYQLDPPPAPVWLPLEAMVPGRS